MLFPRRRFRDGLSANSKKGSEKIWTIGDRNESRIGAEERGGRDDEAGADSEEASPRDGAGDRDEC